VGGGEDLTKDLNALALFLNSIQSEPSIASTTSQISCEVDYIWTN
jgi:hypothetical protein